MKISDIDQCRVYYMRKTSDYLHIKFHSLDFCGKVFHHAGEIIARRVTEEDEKHYLRAYGELASDMIHSETVTRYGTRFWDEGRYIPASVSISS